MLAHHGLGFPGRRGYARILHALSLEDIPHCKNFAGHVLRRALIATKLLNDVHLQGFMQNAVYLRMVFIDERCEKGTQISEMLVPGQLGIGDIVDRPNLNCSALLAKRYTVDGYREDDRG